LFILDETVFIFTIFLAMGWAHKRVRIKVNDYGLKVQTLPLIAAIIEDGGLIHFANHRRAINTEVIVAFVLPATIKIAGDDIAFFLDNLRFKRQGIRC
jgi:hypothetical protein